VDPEFVADLDIVVSNVIYGLLGRFVAGEIGIADILPALERTVFRLTEGYRPAGTR
ncbi:MAG TPA: TetR/AcrR family transcriptional regulator, partial [Mycobacterium sp.]|nr:TetR/AcrR family transcriptional regulator [Mycobacterium sp.]